MDMSSSLWTCPLFNGYVPIDMDMCTWTCPVVSGHVLIQWIRPNRYGHVQVDMSLVDMSHYSPIIQHGHVHHVFH